MRKGLENERQNGMLDSKEKVIKMRVNRLNAIEQYILHKGSASLEELTQKFDVSINTMRRDIGELTERGQIKKVYGGVAAMQSRLPLTFSERASKNKGAKQAVAARAAGLMEDRMTIFLDSGSTVIGVIPYLAQLKDITVITHSLSALYEASQYPDLRTIALGGMYSPATASYVGGTTMETLGRLSIDAVLIAATGVTLERGLTNMTYLEAEIKRSVCERNKRIILLADHSKFGHTALFTFCDFQALDAVVTDRPLPEEYCQTAAQNQVELLIAAPEGEEVGSV